MKNKLNKVFAGTILTLLNLPVSYSDFVVDNGFFNSNILVEPYLAVAFIDDLYFPTLSDAINYAYQDEASNTIYAVAKLKNILINKDCVLSANDTLIIPYEGTTYENPKRTVMLDTFSDSTDELIKENLKTEVLIKENVKFINYGTVFVGGEIGTGTNETSYRQRPTGQTAGKYSQITMENNSSIENYGNLTCYGYIKNTAKENSTQVNNYAGSNTYLPIVVYDYQGGTYTGCAAQISGQYIFPFNIFDFPNCQVMQKYFKDSNLTSSFTFYPTSDTKEPMTTDLKIVGSDGLFEVVSEYTTLKYRSQDIVHTTVDANINTISDKFNFTEITIYGELNFKSISFSISEYTIDTKNFYTPLSYKIKIDVKNDSIFNILSKVKFLKGSSVINEEGGTININESCMLYQTYSDVTGIGKDIYPKDTTSAYFLNNGTLNINSSFSGYIESTIDGANIKTGTSFLNSASGYEMVSGSRGSGLDALKITAKFHEVSNVAFGNIGVNEDSFQLSKFNTNMNYISKNKVWIGSGAEEVISNKAEIIGETEIKEERACFEKGTLILTNRGLIEIENVKKDDKVKSFNHFNGRFEYRRIAAVINHGFNDYVTMLLEFDDGSRISFIENHGLFDIDLMKYVDIKNNNCFEFIGHKFLKYENQKIKLVKLISVKLNVKKTCSYTLISSKNLNCIANGLLTNTTILYGIYNIFKYDKNYCYDKEEVEQAINTYGKFTYNDFNDLISKKVFDDFNFAYFKVSIGKKLLTKEILLGYIAWFNRCIESNEAVIY